MELETIITLITNNGFAIVMCLLLYAKINKQDEQHANEMSELSKAIENNTIALTKLSERLEKE